MLERGQGVPQPVCQCGVVAAAEPTRDEQDARAALAEHERELALAEDRHQWLAHPARPERAECDRDELQAVGELEGHRLLAPDAELRDERTCDALHLVAQRRPGQLAARPVGGDLHDGPLARPVAGVAIETVEDHRASCPDREPGPTDAAEGGSNPNAGTPTDTAAGMPRA